MTSLIIIVAYLIAIVTPTIGDAMTILGATTNTGIGFLLPIVFYNKIESTKKNPFSNDRVISYIVFWLMVGCSAIELYSFVIKKSEQQSEPF